MSMQMVQSGLNNQEVLFNLCSFKANALREYLRCKSEYQQRKADITKYDLRNSITPAIQNHIMINLRTSLEQRDMLYQSALSSQNVTSVYFDACRTVQDWTQAIDYGPYIQMKPLKQAEPFGLGPVLANTISTVEFFEFKKYQVDQEIEVNTMFNQPRCMFWVDNLGNVLSNMKLAFYEHVEEAGFFSKMFSGSDDKVIKDVLIKSYGIMLEIYNDLLGPVCLS